jgi:hypothetical protein
MPLLLIGLFFFPQINVILLFSLIGLIVTKRSSLPLEKYELLGVLHSKTDSILQGNNVPDAASCNLVAFHRRDRCDSSNQLKRPIWSK